jgi:hypothetical protein
MMELEDAMKAVAITAPVEISSLRSKLAAVYEAGTHRHVMADAALSDVENALERLSALGHHYSLVEGDLAMPQSFPQMLYKDGANGLETLTVDGAEDKAEALADGWRESQSVGATGTGDPVPTPEPVADPPTQAPPPVADPPVPEPSSDPVPVPDPAPVS